MFSNDATLNFSTTPRIICQPHASRNLQMHLESLNIDRLMIISDAGIIASGILQPCLDGLATLNIEIFLYTDTAVDPPEEIILSAVEFAKNNKVNGVLGMGGGSCMDTAKLVALLACSNQDINDCYGVDQACGQRLPMILIPTTAGTGSEVTAVSIVTTPTDEKKGVVSPLLYPDIAILDVNLTLGLPAPITAMTGVDAMVHAIEAFTSVQKKNPISDALAIGALKLLFHNIDLAVNEPQNIAARSAMLLGSNMAGMAFANAPVAAVHALAYPLGGHFHMPHGHSNAVVLPGVLKFNAADNFASDCYAQLARELHLSSEAIEFNHVRNENTNTQACAAFLTAMTQLVERMPFSLKISDAGVTEKDLQLLADDAMKIERLLQNNPRPMTHQAAYEIYQALL